MLIWIITVGEPLPTDEGTSRLLRSGILGKNLVRSGHQVVWWASTFDHVKKRQRFNRNTSLRTSDGVDLKLLHGCGYGSNVSLKRFVDHAMVARNFELEAAKLPEPDLIVCSLPPLDLPVAAIRYGKARDIPVIVDVRDLWPDIFLDIVPNFAKPIARILLTFAFRQKKFALKEATAIVAINEAFLEWGSSGRTLPEKCKKVFPLGYESRTFSEDVREESRSFWAKFDVPERDCFTLCFFGNLANHILDLDTVIQAIGILYHKKVPVKLVICGEGPALPRLLELAKPLSNVLFAKWVDAPKIRILMEYSNAGLVPYESRWDFTGSMPNKSIEYLSAGLPIISCLKGKLENFLETECCGIQYQEKSPESLASAIQKLASNQPMQRRFRQNALKAFNAQFEAEVVFSQYISYIESFAQ